MQAKCSGRSFTPLIALLSADLFPPHYRPQSSLSKTLSWLVVDSRLGAEAWADFLLPSPPSLAAPLFYGYSHAVQNRLPSESSKARSAVGRKQAARHKAVSRPGVRLRLGWRRHASKFVFFLFSVIGRRIELGGAEGNEMA